MIFVVIDISIEVRPKSKTGADQLTEEEDDEYHQVQGKDRKRNFLYDDCLDLFWSDPDPQGRKGCRKNADRKIACFFGSDITEEFLKKYNLSMIIRSHQVKQDGYEFTHDGKVLTIFSASNYCRGSNWGAIIRWFVLMKDFFFFFLTIQFRDYNEVEPWLIAFKTVAVEMEKISFNKKYDED
jgi:hypothetical protein